MTEPPKIAEYIPEQHTIVPPMVLSPELTIIGATALVHAIISDFTQFDFHKQKFVMGADGNMIFLYKVDKVIHPMTLYRIHDDKFVICLKYETDWMERQSDA